MVFKFLKQIFFDNVKLRWRRTPSSSKHDGKNLSVSNDIYEPRFLGKEYQSPASDRAALVAAAKRGYDALLGEA